MFRSMGSLKEFATRFLSVVRKNIYTELVTHGTCTTNDEIENLCEAMIKDFFKSKHYTNVMCVDIEAFVQEYLGVPIVYETFAEPDPGRVGFLSDGKRPLMVRRGNKVEQVVFPARTAVIEKYLLNQKESARRRFSIAHEGAHDVLGRHISRQERQSLRNIC